MNKGTTYKAFDLHVSKERAQQFFCYLSTVIPLD